MSFLAKLKGRIPDYAKDVRRNLDAVLGHSPLAQEEMLGCALAAAFAVKNRELVALLRGELPAVEAEGALTAASLMGMNNTWYSYIDLSGDEEVRKQLPSLRMNAYASYGGVSQRQFEMWALSASLIGKCRYCISSNVSALRGIGATTDDLKEVGRISATINAVAMVLSAE